LRLSTRQQPGRARKPRSNDNNDVVRDGAAGVAANAVARRSTFKADQIAVNKEKAMKVGDIIKTVGGVVAIVAACSAFAQSSDTAATAPMASAAPAPMASEAANPKAEKKAASKVNRKLGLDVRRALDKSGVDVSDISVRASNGVVTLAGSVPSGDQIDKAGEAAKGVAGVKSVNNKLGVQPH
jgi:hypothetical protein